jgi:hypothetical protein
MRNWINLLESAVNVPCYVRFGDIPKDERSGIGASPNYAAAMARTGDQEHGVSCYWADWDAGRNMWCLDDIGNAATLDELVAMAKEGARKIYLITGDDIQDKAGDDVLGTDGEPLIRNVQIIKELTLDDIYSPGLFNGTEDNKPDPVTTFKARHMLVIYPNGKVENKNNITMTNEQIDAIQFHGSYNNAIEGDYEGFKAICFRDFTNHHVDGPEELEVNENATKVCRAGFRLSPPWVIKGKLIILVDYTKTRT